MNSQKHIHNIIVECLSKMGKLPLNEGFNPRKTIPRVRGGWNKNKILKYLKATPSNHGSLTAARFIAEFNDIDELKSHIFWHGSPYPQTKLKPSITQSQRWADMYGGGGYGKRYWGISLTSNKFMATRFARTSQGVNVHPVVLAKNAIIKDIPNIDDAIEVEDIIVDLYEEGVDAIRIGDYYGDSENELLVINPQAICNMDAIQYYKCYQLFKDRVPMPTNQQLEDLLVSSKEYIRDYRESPKRPQKPEYPQKPSRFINGDNHEYSRKDDDTYNMEMDRYNQDVSSYTEKLNNYNKELEDFNNSEETKKWNKKVSDLKNKMRI